MGRDNLWRIRTKGAVVIALIRGAAREGVGEHPRVTCNEKSRSPQLWKKRGQRPRRRQKEDSREERHGGATAAAKKKHLS